MTWDLWFSALLLLFIGITLLHAVVLPRPKRDARTKGEPLVSILIPMRNELANVEGLIGSLQKQTYSKFEVIVLDDESTDGTREALEASTEHDSRFTIKPGAPKLDGWVGKVYACHQLSGYASGDYLLYVDADVRIEPNAVQDVLAFMQHNNLALVSGFSRFLLPTWLNKLLVPMQHFIVLFHLPMGLARFTKWPPATAAHGGFMFFERGAYEAIGGHESVKGEIVEDVALSKRMKAHGHKMWLANITAFASCTMYETNEDVWKGFSKNIFNGIGKSVPLAAVIMVFYASFYVLPLFLLVGAVVVADPSLLIPYALISIQGLIVYATTKEPLYLAFALPASALALIALLANAMIRSMQGQKVEWKGRFYG
ncbi:glycosyltransferase family 2 protein [Chryseomicrobium imtechense]